MRCHSFTIRGLASPIGAQIKFQTAAAIGGTESSGDRNMEQVEEFFRWRHCVSCSAGTDLIGMQRQLLDVETTTQTAMKKKARKRNIASFDIAVNIQDTVTGVTSVVTLQDALDKADIGVAFSGLHPKNNFTDASAFPYKVMDSFTDITAPWWYAKQLAAAFRAFNGGSGFDTVDIGRHGQSNPINIVDFLDSYCSKQGEVSLEEQNLFVDLFHHSEDRILISEILNGGLYTDIARLVTAHCSEPLAAYSVTAVNFVLHSRLDLCQLCSRKVAVVAGLVNKGNGFYSKLSRSVATCKNTFVIPNIHFSITAISNEPYQERRFAAGHDNLTGSTCVIYPRVRQDHDCNMYIQTVNQFSSAKLADVAPESLQLLPDVTFQCMSPSPVGVADICDVDETTTMESIDC